LNPDAVMVEFSPDVTRSFARLEAMVQGSEHFDGDVLLNLQELAAGKTLFSVTDALGTVAQIARETHRHIQATKDTRAEEALQQLTTELCGAREAPPIILLRSPRIGRNEGA